MLRALLLPFLIFGAYLGAVEIRVNTSDYDSLPKDNAAYDAIVVNPKGEMVETKATFNAGQGTLTVPDLEGGDNASVFVPELDARYLYYKGNWANPQGNYWDGTGFVTYTNPEWRHDWNDYWHNNWHNRWNPYWKAHRGDHNWKWRDREGWRGGWHRGANWHRRGHDGHRGGRGGHHQSHRSHHSHHGGHKK